MDGTVSHNELRLNGRAFSADGYAARVRMARSTELFAQAFVQFNTQSDELIMNARVNWVYAPLSDLFLVLTERLNLSPNPATGAPEGVAERSVTLKVTRLLAF